MAINSDIGNRIKKARLDKGLSQAQLAALLDVDQSFVSHLENGRNEPDINKLMKLKHILGTTYSYLIEGLKLKDND